MSPPNGTYVTITAWRGGGEDTKRLSYYPLSTYSTSWGLLWSAHLDVTLPSKRWLVLLEVVEPQRHISAALRHLPVDKAVWDVQEVFGWSGIASAGVKCLIMEIWSGSVNQASPHQKSCIDVGYILYHRFSQFLSFGQRIRQTITRILTYRYYDTCPRNLYSPVVTRWGGMRVLDIHNRVFSTSPVFVTLPRTCRSIYTARLSSFRLPSLKCLLNTRSRDSDLLRHSICCRRSTKLGNRTQDLASFPLTCGIDWFLLIEHR